MAMGACAIVRVQAGIPMLPEVPASLARLIASRRYSEPPDIILVAEEYLQALAVAGSIRWAEVVGIACERPAPEMPSPPFRAVTGVANLMNMAEEDSLVLLDANAGVLLLDPDPIEISLYQAERERIAPRQRFFLDEGHLPAKTLDGRVIYTAAQTTYPADIEEALQAGADVLYIYRAESEGMGFFVPAEPPSLPANLREGSLHAALNALTERSNGKPLFLPDDYTLAGGELAEAASRADITLLLEPRLDLPGLGIQEYREILEEAESACAAQERPHAMPSLAVEIAAQATGASDERELQSVIEGLAQQGATRLMVNWESDRVLDGSIGWLANLCVSCGNNGLPVFIALHYDPTSEESRTLLRSFLGAGVSGLRVAPEQIIALKRALQRIDVNECREAVLRFLQRGNR
jgi:hypothetical protein